MAAGAESLPLGGAVALLGAGIVAVVLFRGLRLGSVLGYLAAGLAVGPFGLALVADTQALLHFAELGVVLFLFVIGLEMRPSHLWELRGEIFGLGALQVGLAGLLLTGVGVAAGLAPLVAFFAAMGFTLSSTAIVMQILEERGELATPKGQRVVSILLLEDLAIVPLLALVALLAPGAGETDAAARWTAVGIALAALAGLLLVGRFLLNPMFRLLARARAREIMTAAALFVVLGAALLMQAGGLSMAMGAFLAGVLLSESTFRHQLEADIEPFRGLLLGLFFLGVGMTLDVAVFLHEWRTILLATGAFMGVKALAIYAVGRALRARHAEGIYRTVLLAQGGEFAFVLYAAAAAAGIFDARINAVLTATVILSMALTPLGVLLLRFVARETVSRDGIEEPGGAGGCVLVIGFGRFGQVASQSLLARGVDVTIIDADVEAIRSAGNFGFKVYFGDGTRLDVLRAAGAAEARAIAVCVDNPQAADRIVALVSAEFPRARLLVRAWDRAHALRLIGAGVDVQVRETLESAMRFGYEALRAVDVPDDEAAEIVADVRRRDAERLQLELTGGIYAGRELLHGNVPRPQPLTVPTRRAEPLNAAAAAVTGGAPPAAGDTPAVTGSAAPAPGGAPVPGGVPVSGGAASPDAGDRAV